MPFLPPNQQRQSTEGYVVPAVKIQLYQMPIKITLSQMIK